MNTLLKFLDKMSFAATCALAVLTTIIIGVVDFTIGHELSTALFYMLPVAVASWYGGRTLGILVSLLAAATWLVTDIGAGQEYSHPAILPWNTFVRLAIFMLMALLLTAFRGLLRTAVLAAKTDHLTGAFNWRGFQERLAEEYARSARFSRAFSLAYLDHNGDASAPARLAPSRRQFSVMPPAASSYAVPPRPKCYKVIQARPHCLSSGAQ